MKQTKMTHARARLWLGISCVGSLVVLAIVALVVGLPKRLLPAEATGLVSESLAVLSFLAVIALTLLPFDIYGGLVLPELFDRDTRETGDFFRQYARGVAVQMAVFTCAFLLYRRIGSAYGTGSTIAAFAAVQIVLIAAQVLLAKTIGGLRQSVKSASPNPNVLVAEGSHSTFTGGVAGLPGFETTIIPGRWMRSLSDRLLKTEVRRRGAAIATGSRLRGLLVAVGWNTACFSVALLMPGGGTTSVAALATSFLYFLLFSFVGLLALPTFSRRGVFEVDRAAAGDASAEDIIDLARELDRFGDEEPSRTPGLESVFHPIPCVQRRADALASPVRTSGGAWNAARTALFLSWAFGGPLARAVHCNIGRPELWVLLPAD